MLVIYVLTVVGIWIVAPRKVRPIGRRAKETFIETRTP
jgi:hypothetical protein